jgi:hypothetical protein
VESVDVSSGVIKILTVVFPLAIILTQECDLEQEHLDRVEARSTRDKCLISVLMAPLYNVEHVYLGEHLNRLDIQMKVIDKAHTPGKYLRNNERPRYHYLEFKDVPIVPSVIDFKHYFSATVNYLLGLKATSFVCSVAPLFREGIAQRFAAYLARVGLPDIERCAVQKQEGGTQLGQHPQ